MSLMLTCEIAPGAVPRLEALRLEHLRYIDAQRGLIRFGGPARGPDGTPETMVIVLATEDPAVAERFIAAEPYNASGQVFSTVHIRPWSQVLPEPGPGTIAAAINEEEARAAFR